MRQIKKIESNTIDSIFANCEIENEKLTNILGGGTSIQINCMAGETLKYSEHKNTCNGDSVKLALGCASGATLTDQIIFRDPIFVTSYQNMATMVVSNINEKK
jgi:hypothetical protein